MSEVGVCFSRKAPLKYEKPQKQNVVSDEQPSFIATNSSGNQIPQIVGIMSAAVAAIIVPLTLLIWFSAQLIQTILSLTRPNGGSNAGTSQITPLRCLISVALPALIAQRAYGRRQLSWNGAVSAAVIGLTMTLASYSFMVTMLTFFFVSMRATRINIQWKRQRDPSYQRVSQIRTWLNVVCNGAVPANCALLMMLDFGSGERWIDLEHDHRCSYYTLAMIGALACSCGDTLASDLGSIWGGVPWIVTRPHHHVPPGTNGAVSFVGLALSFVGGMLVGLGFYISNFVMLSANFLPNGPRLDGNIVPQWPVIIVAGFAGFIGSLIDSVLGSTLQFSGIAASRTETTADKPLQARYADRVRYNSWDIVHVTESPLDSVRKICGTPILDNHAVNLLSAFATAIITPNLAGYFWPLLSAIDAAALYENHLLPLL